MGINIRIETKKRKKYFKDFDKKKGKNILCNKPGLTGKEKKIGSSILRKKAKNIYGYKNPRLHQKIKTVFQGF